MNRFLDNSYIQSIGNCTQRRAASIDQLETFARFLGELLVADSFFFTGDPSGPVAPISAKALEEIRFIIGDEVSFENKAFDIHVLRRVCSEVVDHIADEIDYLSKVNLPLSPYFAYPSFKNNANPHEALHGILIDKRISWRRKLIFREDVFGDATSANIAPQVILTEKILDVIAPRISKAEWTLEHTLHLAIAARMLAYDSLAAGLSCTYLPSSGRASIHRADRFIKPVSVVELGVGDSFDVGDASEAVLPPIIDAIIRTSNGDPVKSLELAVALRKDTAQLRKRFARLQPDIGGDACIIEAERLRREYQDVVSSIVKGVRPPSLITALKPILILFGIPSLSVDIEKFGTWVDFKLKEKKVRRVATVLLSARRLPHEDPFELLKKSALGSPQSE